jgi:hypothetical protein
MHRILVSRNRAKDYGTAAPKEGLDAKERVGIKSAIWNPLFFILG